MEDISKYRRKIHHQIKQCDLILEELSADSQPQQLELFGEVKSEATTERDLRLVFSEKHSQYILNLSIEKQQELAARRKQRLETLNELYMKRMNRLTTELVRQEMTVAQKVHVILATMTNMYISKLLSAERFDVIIVEETGMVILPTLFYCVALAKAKVIMVGRDDNSHQLRSPSQTTCTEQ